MIGLTQSAPVTLAVAAAHHVLIGLCPAAERGQPSHQRSSARRCIDRHTHQARRRMVSSGNVIAPCASAGPSDGPGLRGGDARRHARLSRSVSHRWGLCGKWRAWRLPRGVGSLQIFKTQNEWRLRVLHHANWCEFADCKFETVGSRSLRRCEQNSYAPILS